MGPNMGPVSDADTDAEIKWSQILKPGVMLLHCYQKREPLIPTSLSHSQGSVYNLHVTVLFL